MKQKNTNSVEATSEDYVDAEASRARLDNNPAPLLGHFRVSGYEDGNVMIEYLVDDVPRSATLLQVEGARELATTLLTVCLEVDLLTAAGGRLQ